LVCQSLLTLWHACWPHADEVVDDRRRRAPGYRTKVTAATADMLVIARRVLIVAQFSALLPNLRRLGISPHRVRNPRSAARMGHGRRVKSESRVLIQQ
jgi:hypothetical protein